LLFTHTEQFKREESEKERKEEERKISGILKQINISFYHIRFKKAEQFQIKIILEMREIEKKGIGVASRIAPAVGNFDRQATSWEREKHSNWTALKFSFFEHPD
jgi:hypothetical protein